MTEIQTIYKPVWSDVISLSPDREVTICKATEVHLGRYFSRDGFIPEFKVDCKINMGYVVFEGNREGGKLSGEFQTADQPLHEFKTKRMSDKLAREWNSWTYQNSRGFIRELKEKHDCTGKDK